MATISLTPEQLKASFSGQYKSIIYDEAVRLYYRLKVHADGEMPIWLIKRARPNESETVRIYRELIYEAETQNPIERVIGVFEKIRRSPDFMIRFNDDDIPAIVSKDETLEKYLTEKYPVYTSIEDWLFEEAMRNIAIDANAVVAVVPNKFEVLPNTYVEPVARIFNATNVVLFEPEEYAILKTDELSSLLSPQLQQQRLQASYNLIRSAQNSYDLNTTLQPIPPFLPGQVYYVIDLNTYQLWEENPEGKYQLTQIYPHNLGELPVFQLPGKFMKRYGANVLKKTLLYPMVPHLNKAARESNDLDAGVIMHLYLEKWKISNRKCQTCKGTGKLLVQGASPSVCGKCNGSGYTNSKSPMNEIEINPASIGEQGVPIPPVGYVVKDPEILKLQNDRIENHVLKALSSVNMEHLSDVQMNQSGTAKQWDNDGVNNMVYAYAGMLIYVLTNAVYYTNELRYKSIVPDEVKRKKMLPIIPIPEKFDVINTSFLLTEYQAAKTAGVNAIILSEMQREISQKKFYANPKVADFVQIVMTFDPFPDKTIEEKALLEGQGLVTKTDIILSVYIGDFVKRALEEYPDFTSFDYKEMKDIFMKYAKEKEAELSTVNQLMQDIFQTPSNQPGQVPGQVPGQGPGQGQTNQIPGKPIETQQQVQLAAMSKVMSPIKRIANTNF
jgi:hypothetical protein